MKDCKNCGAWHQYDCATGEAEGCSDFRYDERKVAALVAAARTFYELVDPQGWLHSSGEALVDALEPFEN